MPVDYFMRLLGWWAGKRTRAQLDTPDAGGCVHLDAAELLRRSLRHGDAHATRRLVRTRTRRTADFVGLMCGSVAFLSVASAAEAVPPYTPSDGRYPIYGAEVYTTTPTLAVVFKDGDLQAGAGQGWIDFAVYGPVPLEDGGGMGDGLVAAGRGAATSQGGFSRWVVPAFTLQTDTAYRWRARAYDGSSYSAWTDERSLWVRPSSTRANGGSSQASPSADGQTVAFASDASDFIPGDANNVSDIYVRRDAIGLTTRASRSEDGGDSNGSSWEPSLSDDGRYVAFSSAASNLVPGDTNGATDVFVADFQTGDVTRASVTADGSQVPTSTCIGHRLGEDGSAEAYEYLCGTPGVRRVRL